MNKVILVLSFLICISAHATQDESLADKIGRCVDSRMDNACGFPATIQCVQTLQNICEDMIKNPGNSLVIQAKLDALQKQYGKKPAPIGLPTKIGPAASKPLLDTR